MSTNSTASATKTTTSQTTSSPAAPLDALRSPEGYFAMVAIDQRESLRTMLDRAERSAQDHDVIDFKREACRVLSPHASAVLLDARYGVADGRSLPLAPSCSLVLAADHLQQETGQPVSDSDLDPAITADLIDQVGASAVKYLVIYRQHSSADERAETVGRFLQLCRDAGRPSVLEAIVKPDEQGWRSGEQRDDAIVAAAAELCAQDPDLYKAEVPDFGRDAQLVQDRSEQISAAVGGPWVVLSTGVNPSAFPAAVAAAVAGGAHGFLAGRAIWSEATTAADPVAALATTAVGRLDALNAVLRDASRV